MLKTKLVTLSLLALGCVMTMGAAQAAMLADFHKDHGVACQSCHAEGIPKDAARMSDAACIQCHGTIDQVAKKTQAKHLDPDPHYNHLVGLGCLECHKGHEKSVNLCNGCHNIDFKVP